MTEVATVLPNELRLGAPATMPQARSYMFRQQSTLQTYASGNQIQINIPRLQRSYLRKDSYLRFNVDIEETGLDAENPPPASGGTSQLTLDSAGAFGFIQKLEIFDYLGSTVLESISEVPQLMALLLDMGLPGIDHTTNGQTSMGLESGYCATDSVNYSVTGAATVAAAATIFGQTTKQRSATCGRTLLSYASSGSGATLIKYYSAEFAIPLPSFLGFLSKKMIPLHNGFTILITLSSPTTAMFTPGKSPAVPTINVSTTAAVSATSTAPTGTAVVASTTTYAMTVSEVFMECQILELGPVAESMILSSTGGQPLVVHTKSFRSYVGNVNAKAQEFILNMNLNVASMTNILWMMRSKDQLDKINHQSIGNRTRYLLQRWFFQYGSTSLPQNNGIQTMGTSYPSAANTVALKYLTSEGRSGEGFMELMKSRPVDVSHCRILQENYSWDYKYNGQITADTTLGPYWNLFSFSFPTTRPVLWTGKFAAGLNLELASNKSGELISGLNTNGMNTSIRGVFHPLFSDYILSTDSGVRVDAYAEYDAFINVSPGIATTVSF